MQALAGLEAAAAQILIHCDVDVIDFDDESERQLLAASLRVMNALSVSSASHSSAQTPWPRKVVGHCPMRAV